VEKCTSGQSTDVNVIGHTRVACWITKVTDTHPEYVILNALPMFTIVT
jgi:hypothetical protein